MFMAFEFHVCQFPVPGGKFRTEYRERSSLQQVPGAPPCLGALVSLAHLHVQWRYIPNLLAIFAN